MKRPFDGKALGEQIVSFVRAFVSKHVDDLKERIDGVEAMVRAIPAPLKGDPGERGEKGDPGDSIKGDPGPEGPRGQDGLSAFEIAQAKGFAGSADEWLLSLKGERGDIGPVGKDGESIVGPRGEIGPQGPAGDRGEKGDPGTNGKDAYELAVEKGFQGTELQWLESLRGKDGENGIGKDGRDGRDGKDGRDAVEINILPMLEEGKQYPSGVYAYHLGGLVRTNGAGFDVIVNGVAGVVIEHTDERTFAVKTMLTDGQAHEAVVKMPVMLHRGIWKEQAYERGDCVTRDNSTWHCCVDSTTEKPGESKHWQLIVRKGERGRDAPPPAKPQGPVSVK